MNGKCLCTITIARAGRYLLCISFTSIVIIIILFVVVVDMMNDAQRYNSFGCRCCGQHDKNMHISIRVLGICCTAAVDDDDDDMTYPIPIQYDLIQIKWNVVRVKRNRFERRRVQTRNDDSSWAHHVNKRSSKRTSERTRIFNWIRECVEIGRLYL